MKPFCSAQSSWYVGALVSLGLLGWGGGAPAQVQPGALPGPGARGPAVTFSTVRSPQAQTPVDYAQATPLALPRAPGRAAVQVQEALSNPFASQSTLDESGGAVTGSPGTGALAPVLLGVPQLALAEATEATPQEFGTNQHPFSTARADLSPLATNTAYPYSATGKVFFTIGTRTFLCSAALIRQGVVVTAAHCVAAFGQRQFYAGWQFVPGYRNGIAPFGVWAVRQALVLTSYLEGTAPCAVAGIICQDDVALLVLNPAATGDYPGTATGWYGYGWDNFGLTANGLTQITQLGYPVCLDNGVLMARNDSFGFQAVSAATNTIIGSLMCGGASGGPWLVNFGLRPGLTATTEGTAPNANIVVGVTSWGYDDPRLKQQGASPFTNDNIVLLVTAACAAVPAACS